MDTDDGFTLIEVIVAVTVAGIVVLAAHRVFAGVLDGNRALIAARAALDREANARRWLKAAFLSLDAPFRGQPDRVAFTSWQLSAGGWFEPRVIDLWLDGDRLVADGPEGRLALADSVTALAFDYLFDLGAGSSWLSRWDSPVSAPLAVRVRLERGSRNAERGTAGVDTLVYLVKERG